MGRLYGNYRYSKLRDEESPHDRLKVYDLRKVVDSLDNARRHLAGFIITWQWVMAGGLETSGRGSKAGEDIEPGEDDVRYSNEVLAQLDSVVVAAKKMIEEVNGRSEA